MIQTYTSWYPYQSIMNVKPKVSHRQVHEIFVFSSWYNFISFLNDSRNSKSKRSKPFLEWTCTNDYICVTNFVTWILFWLAAFCWYTAIFSYFPAHFLEPKCVLRGFPKGAQKSNLQGPGGISFQASHSAYEELGLNGKTPDIVSFATFACFRKFSKIKSAGRDVLHTYCSRSDN